ncbi:substrate-binding domain-containing protein [Flavobacterium sp. Fl-318]|uniref:Substrate-binding domain-containing protein n=1 Tax=Flavobacterium cupriresistens TaxID=2893885 RepID=A0ABU4R9G3_9FLAO|nr:MULTISPECIES: substrate-binding domain-containing protein [unclassified Flavobacterium]MDX6189194.1 substrate-binding domain-containing protein [Flavobacterium sp. Fl-318]UFH41291.1 substrate-binding domain-containing protein [Flavobacterium sp. F-323]
MKTVKIVGVPEHFNLPWQLCIENGEFEAENIDLQWKNIPEGTGKMCQMLRDEEADIAVILTEGIVKDIAAGNPAKIVQIYVQSPLIWGIHVAAKSDFQELKDLKNKKAAISRLGSGSQLMAYVNANEQGWKTDDLKFEIVNTIDGAVEALTNGSADYFMWEHFMTKPLVDQGIFRRVGDCPTPWPSFVITVRDEFLRKNSKTVEKVLEIINKTTYDFKQIPNIDQTLSELFNQKIEDIQDWLQLTQWSQKQLDEKAFNKIQNQLFDLGIIEKKSTFVEMVKAL